MEKLWLNIITNIKNNPTELHTLPKISRQPKWFHVDTDGRYIYISNAKSNIPSSTLSGMRKLSYNEFTRIYPIHLRREQGEQVSTEAIKATVNQVYWYAIINYYCESHHPEAKIISTSNDNCSDLKISKEQNSLVVLDYEFNFVQNLIPDCETDGSIKKYYPQEHYDNTKKLPLSKYGSGSFCHFSINHSSKPGVYLWVVDEKIIYIGETDNLDRRSNQGYGIVSPRNCYVGGQSTNCKMNKIVLQLFEEGKIIDLYFYETLDYKNVELKLLESINTEFNVKNN